MKELLHRTVEGQKCLRKGFRSGCVVPANGRKVAVSPCKGSIVDWLNVITGIRKTSFTDAHFSWIQMTAFYKGWHVSVCVSPLMGGKWQSHHVSNDMINSLKLLLLECSVSAKSLNMKSFEDRISQQYCYSCIFRKLDIYVRFSSVCCYVMTKTLTIWIKIQIAFHDAWLS